MFFFKHRLKMTSLRIGKHRIVKNIASLRKVNIAHPYSEAPKNSSHYLYWSLTKGLRSCTNQVDIQVSSAESNASHVFTHMNSFCHYYAVLAFLPGEVTQYLTDILFEEFEKRMRWSDWWIQPRFDWNVSCHCCIHFERSPF